LQNESYKKRSFFNQRYWMGNIFYLQCVVLGGFMRLNIKLIQCTLFLLVLILTGVELP